MKWHRVVLSVLMVAHVAACGSAGSGSGPNEEPDAPDVVAGEMSSVDTAATPIAVMAGELVTVTCTAYDEDGVALEGPAFTLVVQPEDGVQLEGSTLTPTVAGAMTVACASGEVVDASPVEIEVRPGPAASTVATLTPEVTAAGEGTDVDCEVRDAFGNVVEDGAPVVAALPPEDVAIDEMHLSTWRAGTYEVTCVVDGADLAEAATWTVEPGEPVSFGLTVAPPLASYGVDQGMIVKGIGEDAHGNLVEDLPIANLSAEPAGHHTLLGDSQTTIAFDLEGFYTLSADSVDHPDWSATLDIVVDQTAPDIVVTSPERGSTADVVTEVVFSGSVSDNLGEVAWLEVQGVPVKIEPEGGTFEVTVPLEHGINILSARAADPYGNQRTVARSVLWSDGWYTLDPAAFETDGVGDGLLVDLSQEAVDDGVHDPAELNDLATIMGVAIAGMDLSGMITNPLVSFPCITGDCVVNVDSVTVDASDVSLTLIDGGIHVTVVLYDLTLDLSIVAPPVAGFPVPPIAATFVAGMVNVDMDMMLSMQGDELVVDAQNTSVDLDDTSVVLLDNVVPLLNTVINQGLDLIEPALLGVIETVLPFVIEDQMGQLVGGLTEGLAIDQTFDLPSLAEGEAGNAVRFQTQPNNVIATPEYLRIVFDGLASSLAPSRPYPVPGSPRYQGCGPAGSVPVPPSSPVVAGVHDDLLNQLLFAIWEGGTLSIDLDQEAAAGLGLGDFGVELENLSVDPMLPMMLNSCSGEDRIQIGDLYLDTTLDLLGTPSHIAIWLQAEALVNITVSEGVDGATKLGFELDTFDPILIEVITNEGMFEGDDAGLTDLIATTMLPMLISNLAGDALGFEIPAIDLGQMSDDIPEGTSLTLDLQEVGRSGAYLTIEGALK